MSDMGLDNILGDMKKTYYESKSDEKRDVEPVSIKKFLYSKEYLNLPFVLSERQYKFLEAMDDDIVRGCKYNEACLIFGKGSIFSDTIISDAFGNRKTIKEIHDNKEYFQINGLNGRTYKSEIQEAIPPFIEGHGKIMEVITKTGRKIKVWEGHKFLTVNGWVPLNKIKDKTSIAMNKSFKIIKNRDDEISNEKLRAMGYLIGDGCIIDKHRPHLIATEPEIIEDYCNILKSEFDIKARVDLKENVKSGKTFCIFAPYGPGNKLLKLLRDHELYGKTAKDKFVPDIVFQLSNEKIAHFIAGLWDTDGTLCTCIDRFGKRRVVQIEYSSKSERLVRDIAELLIRFGIVAKIRSKKVNWKGEKRTYWMLYVCSFRDAILFTKNIKLQSKRKVKSIELFMKNNEISHKNRELLPKDVCDRCRKIYREIYKPKYKHYRNDGEEGRIRNAFKGCRNFICGHQGISRNKLKEINNEIKNEEIDKILSDDIYWDQIKSVKYIRDDYYYSTTVPTIGTYYAQGFVNSNSGKDSLVAIYFARRAYKLLCMADPQGYFKSQSFELLNVAASEEQCKGVFFKYLTDTFKNAGEKAFKVFGFDPEKDITSDKIKLPKSITCISGHSKAASLEGKNLYCAVLDEVAEFKTEEEIGGKGRHAAMSAAAIYRLCRSSINTRFPGCGKLILISFPRFKKDFIMTQYEKGKNRPNVYCDKAATFEVNPTKKESDFAADLELEPEFTRTAIYCDPPHAKDAFITQTQFIDRIVNDKIKSPYKVGISGEYKESFRGTKNDKNKYVISCDLALKNDRAALSMCHKETYKGRPLYIVDLIKTWEAEPGKIIRLRDIYNEIIILRYRGFNIVQVNFDQYASAQMIQDLIENGFHAQKQSVDRTLDPYLALRNIIYQEALYSYKHPLLLQELKELQLINGVRVDHPSHGCFTGDTRVRLTDGRSLSFLELIDEYKKGKELYTYSVDLEKKLIVPKKINNPRLTIKKAEIIKITLDNGEEIRCTPNHRFMLLNGEYKEAQYLTVKDYLMSLFTPILNISINHKIKSIEKAGYEDVYDITIDGTHNFALDTGVFVHNSKDSADATCSSIYTLSTMPEHSHGASVSTF